MKIAILSDIHSNIEALKAVLHRVDSLKIKKIYCLGDVVGYGPNPLEVLQLAKKRFDICILGNHDEAVLKKPVQFNRIPENAVYWTKDVMKRFGKPSDFDYLKSMVDIHRDEDLVLSHGILENNMFYTTEAEDLFYIFENMTEKEFVCFGGHSHQPAIWTLENKDLFSSNIEPNTEFQMNPETQKNWINIGSVGQPRDKDTRACFVVYDTENKTINFQRVEYNWKITADKIRKIDALDNFLADRLAKGI